MLEEQDLKKIGDIVQKAVGEAIEQLVLPLFDEVFRRLDKIEVRLDGVETRLDHVEIRLDGMDTRLGDVETRLGHVETRLDGVETGLDSLTEQVGFLTKDMEVVKDYILPHQKNLEDHEERIKILENQKTR